jgi:hypothetical protein
VYDMYPWNDGPSSRRRPGTRLPAPRDGRDPIAAADEPESEPEADAAQADAAQTEATQAVQVALDRRDNGGDAVGAVSPATPARTRQ